MPSVAIVWLLNSCDIFDLPAIMNSTVWTVAGGAHHQLAAGDRGGQADQQG
jgi:hypothetical protein